MSDWFICTRPSSSSAFRAHKADHDSQGGTWYERDHGPTLSVMPRMYTVAGSPVPINRGRDSNSGGGEMKVGSRVLAIWKALAKRRAEERHTHRQQARDAGMEYFKATRLLNRSIGETLGDPLQWPAFVLEVAFTGWRLRTINLRRARRQRLLCQRSKQSDTGERLVSRAGVAHAKNVQHDSATHPRRRTPHFRKCCQAVQGHNIPAASASPIRPEGQGDIFRTGKGSRAGLSSADKANPCSRGGVREVQQQHSFPATRAPMLNIAQQFFSNHAAVEQWSGEEATPHNIRSPFVVGGPLYAEYPSYWTAAGISAFNTVDPRPLVAWTAATAAEKQQQVSASGHVPSEGGYKRRGLGTQPSRGSSANRSKHRRIVPPTGTLATKGCFPSCKGAVHHHKNNLKRSACFNVSQDPFGSLRASSARGRVGRRPSLPLQGVLKTGNETRPGPQASSVFFGRCMVIVD